MKKRIMIFNGYYYPSKNSGGPITSIENVVNSCCDDYEFYIVCYNHDFNDSTPYDVKTNTWITLGNANVMYVPQGYLDFSIKRMNSLLVNVEPSLIWFSGVLTPNNKIVASICAKKMDIPILFSPRGEVSEDRVKLKAYKKVPYLRLVNALGFYDNCYFHATSDDEEEGLHKYFKPSDSHLYKVANIPISTQAPILKHKKEKDSLKVFFFSRIHEVKNLHYAIECASECKKNITFNIYGPIESEAYWQECVAKIDAAPKNVSINYGGILNPSNKAKIIQEHDCFLFPTINENYGHVIAESLANSRPVILSKGTTPWDDLDGVAGYAVSLKTPSVFTEKLDYLASLEQKDFNLLIKKTEKYFNEKTEFDDSVSGHKQMFKEIIK